MKVKELIFYLQGMPQDLEVYGFCDDAQSPQKVCSPEICCTEHTRFTLEDGKWCLFGEEDEGSGYIKRFVLL